MEGGGTPPVYNEIKKPSAYRVKRKFEEIMQANMWLSGLLLNSVPVKQSDTSCSSERIQYVTMFVLT